MFNINQNFALKSAELFNFERDAYRTTADLFGQPLTYFPDRFVVTVTSDGSRYQLDKSKAPSNKLTPTDTLSDAERRACWLPLPTVADKAAFKNYVGKSEIVNMVTSTGLTDGTITIAAGDGKAVKSLANGSKGQILKIGTNGLEWDDESTFTLSPPKDGNIGGVKPGSGLTVDTAGTLSIKLGSGLGFDTNGNVGISNALRLTDTTLDGNITITGNTTITGTATVSDPSNTENDSQQIANVKYVNRLVGELSQALVFIGEVSGGITPSDAKVGYVYVVTDNKTYAGQKCEPGDTLICKKEGIQTSDGWIVVEKNIDGAVTASSGLTNGAIVVGSGGTKVHTIATPTENGMVLQSTANGIEWKKPSTYSLTAATKSDIGGVIIGDGINVTSNGTISLSGGTGISISNDTISNTGVISVTSGTSANKISVKKGNNTTEIITINNVENASTVNGHTVEKNVPSNAVFTDDSVSQRTYNSHGIPDPYERPLLIGSSIIKDGTLDSTTGDTFVSAGITASVTRGTITATGGFIGEATSAGKLSVNGVSVATDDEVLLVGRITLGITEGGATLPEFEATTTISSYKLVETTIYDMNVTLAVDALSARKVAFPLIIKPLNDKGELDKNVYGKNWIEYDGRIGGEGLDAIEWGDIDKLFNATPTV